MSTERGRTNIVVGVPAGELASEHEVVAITLENGGGLDVGGPEVDVACDIEVVGGEGVDAQTIGPLYSSSDFI